MIKDDLNICNVIESANNEVINKLHIEDTDIEIVCGVRLNNDQASVLSSHIRKKCGYIYIVV